MYPISQFFNFYFPFLYLSVRSIAAATNVTMRIRSIQMTLRYPGTLNELNDEWSYFRSKTLFDFRGYWYFFLSQTGSGLESAIWCRHFGQKKKKDINLLAFSS